MVAPVILDEKIESEVFKKLLFSLIGDFIFVVFCNYWFIMPRIKSIRKGLACFVLKWQFWNDPVLGVCLCFIRSRLKCVGLICTC